MLDTSGYIGCIILAIVIVILLTVMQYKSAEKYELTCYLMWYAMVFALFYPILTM